MSTSSTGYISSLCFCLRVPLPFSFSVKVRESKPQNTAAIIHAMTNSAVLFHCAVVVCFIQVSSFVEVPVGMSGN